MKSLHTNATLATAERGTGLFTSTEAVILNVTANARPRSLFA
jgi:hypothetical protein